MLLSPDPIDDFLYKQLLQLVLIQHIRRDRRINDLIRGPEIVKTGTSNIVVRNNRLRLVKLDFIILVIVEISIDSCVITIEVEIVVEVDSRVRLSAHRNSKRSLLDDLKFRPGHVDGQVIDKLSMLVVIIRIDADISVTLDTIIRLDRKSCI